LSFPIKETKREMYVESKPHGTEIYGFGKNKNKIKI
jgi:hypothetical protein